MRRKIVALSILGLVFSLSLPQVLAQRGGRGGGGGQRGGGGGQRGGGGFGGGLSEGSRGGESRGNEGSRGSSSMGPYGHEGGSGGSRPGAASGGERRPGESTNTTRPGTANTARPGMPGSGNAAARPAGAASGSGYRPGVGAGAAAGAAYANNSRPSAAAGAAAGAAYANNNRPIGGTYHVPAAALADQGAAVRSASTFPAYSPTGYGANASAWQPTNLANSSLYANPGYAGLAATLGLARQPMPFDYGGNVVAQSDSVYINGDNAGTPQQYADQASQLAAAGSSPPAPDSKWQPLGVFAMVEGDQTSSDDSFQLAVNQQGQIRGNYQNLKDGSVVALAGSVDPKTQRAAWTIGGDKMPTYEAGIANLTQDETTMLLHTGDGQPPRQFSLIRMRQPMAGN